MLFYELSYNLEVFVSKQTVVLLFCHCCKPKQNDDDMNENALTHDVYESYYLISMKSNRNDDNTATATTNK